MSEHYCHIHGKYTVWLGSGGCPQCQAAELQVSRDLEQMARDAKEREEARQEAQREHEERAEELVEEQVYRANNPGDYECPYCLLISLKRGARRCPKCQHDIEADHWRRVYAREEEERRREEEERRRAENARLEQQRAHEEWLRSPAGMAATRATAAQAAAKAHADKGRDLADKALLFALGGLCCGPLLIVGLVLGIMAINQFSLGNDKKGIGKAIFAVVLGSFLILVIVLALIAGAMAPHGAPPGVRGR